MNTPPDWLHNCVINGLQWLATLSLRNTPQPDVLPATATAWVQTLWSMPLSWDEHQDRGRMGRAFTALAANRVFWPAPIELLQVMEQRKQPIALPPPKTKPAPDRRAKLLQVRNDLALGLKTLPLDRQNKEGENTEIR